MLFPRISHPLSFEVPWSQLMSPPHPPHPFHPTFPITLLIFRFARQALRRSLGSPPTAGSLKRCTAPTPFASTTFPCWNRYRSPRGAGCDFSWWYLGGEVPVGIADSLPRVLIARHPSQRSPSCRHRAPSARQVEVEFDVPVLGIEFVTGSAWGIDVRLPLTIKAAFPYSYLMVCALLWCACARVCGSVCLSVCLSILSVLFDCRSSHVICSRRPPRRRRRPSWSCGRTTGRGRVSDGTRSTLGRRPALTRRRPTAMQATEMTLMVWTMALVMMMSTITTWCHSFLRLVSSSRMRVRVCACVFPCE